MYATTTIIIYNCFLNNNLLNWRTINNSIHNWSLKCYFDINYNDDFPPDNVRQNTPIIHNYDFFLGQIITIILVYLYT